MEKHSYWEGCNFKGALWRVGDGKQIKIWGDNRLPTKSQPKVTSPMIFKQQNSSVEVLINQATHRWRNEVIDHCFSLAKAEVIKGIPLSQLPSQTNSYGLLLPRVSILLSQGTDSSSKAAVYNHTQALPHPNSWASGKSYGEWRSQTK